MSSLRKLLAISSIASGIGNMGLCFSVLNTILAVIQHQLGATTTELQWVINIYGLFIAPFLVIMGRLGDRYGYKMIFNIGLLFLVISTFGTAFAPNIYWIIFFQAFFGLAGAILLPISQVLLFDIYGPGNGSRAMGLWTMAGGLTLAFGPIAAGILTEFGSWHVPFMCMGVVALLSLILAQIYIAEPKRHNRPELDIKGTILLMLTIAVFVLAVMQTGTWKISIIVGLFFLSAILLTTLLVVEKSAKAPIIQEHLFTQRKFLCAAMANALMIFYVWSVMFLVPLYLQTTLHYSILITGCIMLFLTIPLTVMSNLCGRFYAKFGPRAIISFGYALIIIATIFECFYNQSTHIWLIAIANILFGTAWALVMVPAATTAMADLEQDNAGAGAGTFNTLQEIGGVVGLTIVVTVVRLHTSFIIGLHEGFLTLLIVGVIGLGFSLALKRSI